MQPVKEAGFLVSEPLLPFTAFINKNTGAKIHWHTYIELLYVITGNALITIEREEYYVSPGDLLIINSHESHSSYFYEEISSEILVIQFEPSVVNPNLSSLFESKYIVPFLQREAVYSKHIQLENECILKLLFHEILSEFAEKKSGYELNVKGNIYKIFSWLIRNNFILIPSGTNLKSSELARLKGLLEYIEQNFHEPITNDAAAKMSCMSYHHFCRFFKRVTGKTFIEYLNFVRLCEAEKMLFSSEEGISQIALNAGFPSISYFNRLFKKEKGLSPLSFRKQNSSKKDQNKHISG